MIHRKRWYKKKNPTISFYFLYTKKEKLYPDYVLKYYSKPEKQVVCFDHSKYEKMVL